VPGIGWVDPSSKGFDELTGKKHGEGYIDPSTISNQAYRGMIGVWNGYVDQMADIQSQIDALAPDDPKRDDLGVQLNKVRGQLQGIAPQTANIVQQSQKDVQGQFLPGTTATQKKITIAKRNPQTGQYELQTIDNPGAEESDAMQTERLRTASQEKIQGMSDEAQMARTQATVAGQLAVQNAADRANLQRTQLTTGSSERIANVNSMTSRVTTALSAAVQQRTADMENKIRQGDLSLRDATEQFNEWYKQHVEAPLEILKAQQSTAQTITQAQQAVTQRATAESEHQRGVAQIGQQMWNSAAQAYNQMIPLTVGGGWGQGYQQNLTGKGYTPNAGATYNVPESLDQFATRKVAEQLAGVSPYAQNILAAQGQMGNPGMNTSISGSQSGQPGLLGLTNEATNVMKNSLANPFQYQGMAVQQPAGHRHRRVRRRRDGRTVRRRPWEPDRRVDGPGLHVGREQPGRPDEYVVASGHARDGSSGCTARRGARYPFDSFLAPQRGDGGGTAHRQRLASRHRRWIALLPIHRHGRAETAVRRRARGTPPRTAGHPSAGGVGRGAGG
jgi:hypothetical protein